MSRITVEQRLAGATPSPLPPCGITAGLSLLKTFAELKAMTEAERVRYDIAVRDRRYYLEEVRAKRITSKTRGSTKVSDEQILAVYEHLRNGATEAQASVMVGMNWQWISQRKRHDEVFARECERAKAECRMEMVKPARQKIIEALNSEDCEPDFALKVLTKVQQENFGDKVSVEHSGAVASVPFGDVAPISDKYRSALGIGGGEGVCNDGAT